MDKVEILGTVFGLLYVILAIKEQRLCWIAAIISSACYIKVFFDSQLYTESALQIFFIVLSVKGFIDWKANKLLDTGLKIHKMPIKQHIIACVLVLALSICLGYFVNYIRPTTYIYIDAAITCFSIFTTWLATKKVLESWVYWVVIDVVAACLYLIKELYLTSGLYSVFVVLAILGYLNWNKLMQQDEGKLIETR